MQHKYEKLPTGKAIIMLSDEQGRVISETQSYGLLDIAIKIEYDEGAKLSEIYFVKKRMVRRIRYEKEREGYPDMPRADSEVEDFGGALLGDIRAERRTRLTKIKEHYADADAATRTDAFCMALLDKGRSANAGTWIESKEHTLGEFSHIKSRNMIRRLLGKGAESITVCNIDKYDGGQENSGHVVIGLPDNSQARKSIFSEIDRLALSLGFDGEFDNGQRYAYVKLD